MKKKVSMTLFIAMLTAVALLPFNDLKASPTGPGYCAVMEDFQCTIESGIVFIDMTWQSTGHN